MSKVSFITIVILLSCACKPFRMSNSNTSWSHSVMAAESYFVKMQPNDTLAVCVGNKYSSYVIDAMNQWLEAIGRKDHITMKATCSHDFDARYKFNVIAASKEVEFKDEEAKVNYFSARVSEKVFPSTDDNVKRCVALQLTGRLWGIGFVAEDGLSDLNLDYIDIYSHDPLYIGSFDPNAVMSVNCFENSKTTLSNDDKIAIRNIAARDDISYNKSWQELLGKKEMEDLGEKEMEDLDEGASSL